MARYRQAIDTIPLPEFIIALGETQEAAGLEAERRQSYELVEAIRALFEENGVNVDLELALFEANHGDPVEAVELAGRAYAVQPNVKAADALGWALHRSGRSVEAFPYAEEALRLGAPYGPFHFHAGMIALKIGDRAAARRHLAEALDVPATLAPLDRLAAEEALGGLP